MSVTENNVTCRKDFTIDQFELSKPDYKWIYSLKTRDGGVWKGGDFFRETDLTLTR